MPGAEVTVTNTETGWTRSATSSDVGAATFTTVPPGNYEVRVNISGFKEFRTTGVRVSEDNVLRVNSLLEVGQVTDTVTVSAGVAVLQTDRADVRTEIPAAQLENLPVPVGRNYQNLFVTVPGISPPENMHSVAVNPARGLAFSSNGTTRNANAIRIEGAISNNLWLPHVAAYVPALEAIESVGVTTSTFDADQGLSGGMSANVLIKSGTNELHGSVVRVFLQRVDEVAAVLPAGRSGQAAGAGRTSSAARSAGRIVRNKLFFFGSYQGTFDKQLAQRFGTVPTAAMRNGDFSASPTPIYDPATGNASTGVGRTAFPGNIIPRDRFDPIVQKLIADLPLPNQPGLVDNYFATGDYTFDRHNIDAKVNYNATNKLGITARLGWLGYNFRNPAMFGALGGLPINNTAAKAGTGLGDTYTFTGSASYVLSPNFLIDTYAGITTIEVLSEPDRMDETARPRFSRHSRHERARSRRGRLAALRHHELLGDRLRGQRELAIRRRQLAGAIHGERDVHERARTRSGSAATSCKQAMNRHELGNGSGSFTFAGGPTALVGRAVGESVQHLRVVPARASDRRVEGDHSVRGRLHEKPQLAVQLLREGPVAADSESHGVARRALRLLPGRHRARRAAWSATTSTPTRC